MTIWQWAVCGSVFFVVAATFQDLRMMKCSLSSLQWMALMNLYGLLGAAYGVIWNL